MSATILVARETGIDLAEFDFSQILSVNYEREFLLPAAGLSPDAELIRLCDRLVEIHNAWVKLGETIRDDKGREAAGAPLHQEWLDIRAQFFDMKRPITR